MATAPYDTLEAVLNTARVRLNDAYQTPVGAPAGQVGGEVLSDNALFTLPTINGAWRRLQEFLVGLGFDRLMDEVTVSNVSPAATTDPGTFCYLDWTGYFDGVTLNASPVLPQTFIAPLRMWERTHGATGAAAEFVPMELSLNGISDQVKLARNYSWEWRDDKVYFPGSTAAMDLRLRFSKLLADFVDSGTTAFSAQPVPIMRALDSFAWYICSEAANARGDLDGAQFDTKAEAAATKLATKDAQLASKRGEWTIPDIPPATGATPYDSVSTMLNAARARLNSVNKIAADIIAANQPFTQQCANNAYRKFQEYLANKGSVRLTDEVIITNLSADVNPDPAIQVRLDWNGYFNGTTTDNTIVLPQNMIMPWKLYERQTGVDALFIPMGQILNGLPSIWTQQPFNRVWEWRSDAIYMSGATQPTDLRIRYHKYLPDFVGTNTVPWYLAQIQITRSTDALSLYFCAEVACARPDLEMDPAMFQKSAEDAADLVYNRDVRRTQQTTTTRRSLSGRLESGGAYADGYGQYGY